MSSCWQWRAKVGKVTTSGSVLKKYYAKGTLNIERRGQYPEENILKLGKKGFVNVCTKYLVIFSFIMCQIVF